MNQLTKNEAIAFYESGLWTTWAPDQVVTFQLFQDTLCLPFGVFHEAMEQVLGRPVFTHEFAHVDLLRAEYLKLRPMPTLEQVINQIPEEKRLIIWH